jgi:4-hydroxy-tetrahydrodipicolinate synthase
MLKGIWPVLCTPFLADGAIDVDAMADVARFAVAAGVTGVVYPGFASEVDELTASERQTLLRAVGAAVDQRVPIVAGATAATLDDVIARTREAADLNIFTVMVQAPKGIGTDVAGVTSFYKSIAAAAPATTLILQNAPAPRGSDLSPGAVLSVVGANPSVRFVKEETIPSGAPISAILAASPPHLEGVFGGGGARFVIDEFLRGACGAMPAVEFADIHVAMWAALAEGDEAMARLYYERTLPLLVIQSHARMRFTKRVLMRRGIVKNDFVRAQIPAFDERDLAEIDALLNRIGDLMTIAPLRPRVAS